MTGRRVNAIGLAAFRGPHLDQLPSQDGTRPARAPEISLAALSALPAGRARRAQGGVARVARRRRAGDVPAAARGMAAMG